MATSTTSIELPLRTFEDSGAPEGSTDYTTVVIIHGFAWHSGVFKKLMPLAKRANSRIVLLNRRDYPSSDPYTHSELETIRRLSATPPSPGASAETEAFMRDRGREIYDYLVDFVRRERIPPARGNKGGIVIVGWSLGVTFITALLANVAFFPEADVQLSKYVRRVVLYDGSFLCFGDPHPASWWQPLFDETIPENERAARFSVWVGGYFAHGDFLRLGADALEFRNPLPEPTPTATRMTPEELTELTYPAPAEEGGSEGLICQACIAHGTYVKLRESALFPPAPVEGASDWRGAQVRHLWCDRTIWEVPLATKYLIEELDEAKKAGKPLRDFALVRLEGGNHFAHWDMPERLLEVLLADRM
ncbi:hypothetical protein C8Q77DRAFT_1067320 [Trametes polyzona]|nr:hypothetical protein C8Q77DRAFT_1067320 [Trametes polyzona]